MRVVGLSPGVVYGVRPRRRRYRLEIVRIIRVVLAIALAAVLQVTDGVHFNAAEGASVRFRYSLVAWEAGNLLDKWTHRLSTFLPWTQRDGPTGRTALDSYLELSREIGRLSYEIDRAASVPEREHDHGVLSALHFELSSARAARMAVRNDAEELVEATVSAVLSELGLGSYGPVDYPPVDIRLDDPPSVVVTSPRHTISRGDEALVVPGLSVVEREGIEEALLAEKDLSALVSDIGGVATYPAIVRSGFPLRHILQTAAHEWLHHYLVAHLTPLGLRTYRSNEMLTINETLADLAGREIGDIAYVRLGGTIDPPPSPGQAGTAPEEGKFDFGREMRTTRLQVDSLLAEGRIEEAETYMEDRRLIFVENGYHLRKINQAYFAFAGTYAEQPQSSDPVGAGMRRLRSSATDLTTFISTVSAVSTPEEFAALVEGLGEGRP